MNDLLATKTNLELVQSLLAEAAKANNELACARKDIDKAARRLNFLVLLANTMIEREQINGTKNTSIKTHIN